MRQIVKIIKIVAVLCIFFASVVPSSAQEEINESVVVDTMNESVPEVAYDEPIIEEAPEYVEPVVESVEESTEEVPTDIESVPEESSQLIESEEAIEVEDETIEPVLKVTKVIDDNTLFIEGLANPGVLVHVLKHNQVVGSDYADNNGMFEVELVNTLQAGSDIVIESLKDSEKIAALNESVLKKGVNLLQALYETSEKVVGVTSPERKVEFLDSQHTVISSGLSDVNGQFVLNLKEALEIGGRVSIRVYDRNRMAREEEVMVEFDPSIVIETPDIVTEIDEETLYIEGNAQPNLKIKLLDAEGNEVDSVMSVESGRFSFDLDAALETGGEVQFVVTDGWRTSESVRVKVREVEAVEQDVVVEEDVLPEELPSEDSMDQLVEGLFDVTKPLEDQIVGLDEVQLRTLIEEINLNRDAFERLLKEQTQTIQPNAPETVNNVIMSLIDQLIGLKKSDEYFELEDFLLSNESLLLGLTEEERKMFLPEGELIESIDDSDLGSSFDIEAEEELFIQLDHEVYEDTMELVGKTVAGALVVLKDSEGNVIHSVRADDFGDFKIVLDEKIDEGQMISLSVKLGDDIDTIYETILGRPRMFTQSMSLATTATTYIGKYMTIDPVYDTDETIRVTVNLNTTKGILGDILGLLFNGGIIKNYYIQVSDTDGNFKIDSSTRDTSNSTIDIAIPKQYLSADAELKVSLVTNGWGWWSLIPRPYSNAIIEEHITLVTGNRFGFSSTPPTNITFESTQISNEPNKVIPRVGNIPISLSIEDTRPNGQWTLAVSSTPMTHVSSSHKLENALYFKESIDGVEQSIENTSVIVDQKKSDDSTHEKRKHWNQGEGIILKTNPIHAMPGEYTSTITWTLTDGP